MEIEFTQDYLFIDFNRRSANWALFVIDDRWDWVRTMVVGTTDEATGAQLEGLSHRCIDAAVVNEYYKSLGGPKAETLLRTLLLLPWIAAAHPDIAGVLFSDFLYKGAEIVLGPTVGVREWRTAILIDLLDERKRVDVERTVGFFQSWEKLDNAGVPGHVRAVFTRGGVDGLPEWVEQLPKIVKEPPQGAYDAFRHNLHRWFDSVRGQISPAVFDAAKISCHNPSELQDTDLEIRTQVCRQLLADDLYGVWRWCSISALEDPVAPDAARRWLAGKAFQTWPATENVVPLLAIIAICEGAKELPAAGRLAYQVASGIDTIEVEEIDSLKALGVIRLRGAYGDFGPALRDWLTEPEQFKPGKGYIASITVKTDAIAKRATLTMQYSAALPSGLFNSSGRKGRVRRCWDRLMVYAEGYAHSDDVVDVVFFWEE